MALRDKAILGIYEGAPRFRVVGPGWALDDDVPIDEVIFDSMIGPAWHVLVDAIVNVPESFENIDLPKFSAEPVDFALMMARPDNETLDWVGSHMGGGTFGQHMDFLDGRWTPREFYSFNEWDNQGDSIDTARLSNATLSSFSNITIEDAPYLRVGIGRSEALVARIIGFAAVD